MSSQIVAARIHLDTSGETHEGIPVLCRSVPLKRTVVCRNAWSLKGQGGFSTPDNRTAPGLLPIR